MSSADSSSYWCHRCNRFVRVLIHDSNISCPNCNGGFVEQIESPARFAFPESRRRRIPAMYMIGNPRTSDLASSPTPRRRTGERSPFNPVIVLRGGVSPDTAAGFELYYDGGVGSGLRPLPATMLEALFGSGFDRLLDQLTQIEVNGIGRVDNPPASKSAIESMPTIEITETHISTESYCAVCKEAFELGTEVREMPCKHIYHSSCILPWLSIRNSCPVCRHELPSDVINEVDENHETVGLTIWRLPGGGFAVGRFSGGIRGGREGELPVVYTEMDGGFNNNNSNGNGLPRRISWASRGRVARESGGLRRVLRNLFSCFGGITSSSASSSSSDTRLSQRNSSPLSVFSTSSRRRRGLTLDVNNVESRRW